MKHKLYIAAMIVLPLFIGSGATCDIIRFISGNDIGMNPIVAVLWAIMGLGTGIFNLWSLIEKLED